VARRARRSVGGGGAACRRAAGRERRRRQRGQLASDAHLAEMSGVAASLASPALGWRADADAALGLLIPRFRLS
jgi:hypothetical protein